MSALFVDVEVVTDIVVLNLYQVLVDIVAFAITMFAESYTVPNFDALVPKAIFTSEVSPEPLRI